MFGTPRRAQRPVLLIIVFGVFIAIVGITAVAQILLVSAHFSTSTLNSVVGTDAALVRTFVTSTLSPDDLGPIWSIRGPTRAARDAARLPGRSPARSSGSNCACRMARSSLPTSRRRPAPPAVPARTSRAALAGHHATATLADGSAQRGHRSGADHDRRPARVLPARDRWAGPSRRRDLAGCRADPGPARGPAPRHRPRDPDGRHRGRDRPVLHLPFGPDPDQPAGGRPRRRGPARPPHRLPRSRRPGRHRRDVHRALESRWATVRDRPGRHRQLPVAQRDLRARRRRRRAADRRGRPDAGLAARRLSWAGTVRTSCSSSSRPSGSTSIDGFLATVRAALVDRALQYGVSERLPITLSIGVCTFPEHAESATGLLTIAATTLQEAKSSGGDAVRFAGTSLTPARRRARSTSSRA